jgi:DNA-binding NarL/FixJ family response regulator
MDRVIRVAVCDDAPAVTLFLRHVLAEDGDIEVVSATKTGGAALEELAEHRPDALLLDLVLPDVADPATLVRQARERSPETAILLISNMPQPTLEQEAARVGADGWMAKASKPERVREAIRALVAPRAG